MLTNEQLIRDIYWLAQHIGIEHDFTVDCRVEQFDWEIIDLKFTANDLLDNLRTLPYLDFHVDYVSWNTNKRVITLNQSHPSNFPHVRSQP